MEPTRQSHPDPTSPGGTSPATPERDPPWRSDEDRGARTPLLSWPLIGAVWGYRLTLGLVLRGHCRYVPSCSQYAIDALREHGPIRGAWMAACRLGRCHPLGRGGYDPVPVNERRERTKEG